MSIVALAFIYQVYTNFKKEQHKASKRNPKKPALTKGDQEVSTSVVTMTEGELARRRRQERQLAERSKQAAIAVQKLKIEQLEEAEAFDLRDAVIKAAILERPYK